MLNPLVHSNFNLLGYIFPLRDFCSTFEFSKNAKVDFIFLTYWRNHTSRSVDVVFLRQNVKNMMNIVVELEKNMKKIL